MSKYFLLLSIAILPSSCIIGMEHNIPKLKLTPPQPSRQPLTPRKPNAAKYLSPEQLLSYPAHQAYCFIELVNTRHFTAIKQLIDNEKNFRGYGPAIIIKQTLNGNIEPHSPFYSQKAWQNWDENSVLNKEAFKAATLCLLECKASESSEASDKMSNTYERIQNLE